MLLVGGSDLWQASRAQFDEWNTTIQGWGKFRKTVEAARAVLVQGQLQY